MKGWILQKENISEQNATNSQIETKVKKQKKKKPSKTNRVNK